MRRDRHREIGFTRDVERRISSRVTEAGGMPQGEINHDLRRKMAERLGIIRKPNLDLAVPERRTDVDLGNSELPVSDYKSQIIESVRDNLITIIVAETGAGKSTQVPQYLFEQGYDVVMTQPRRIAAQMLSEQIDRELVGSLETEGYGHVGYQTARNNTINDRTRIAVVTDGLRLVQELNERDEIENEVLIIDEVHEWNTNMELLIALVRKMSQEKPRLRVVIMSATIDANALAQYFTCDNRRPPIIEIPGRTHTVEMTEEPESDVVREAVKHATADKTVLVFLPGLREIEDTKDQIHRMLMDNGVHGVVLLSLHGDMSPQEQEAITRTYHGPKIICATNVAQTSITIPDVDVVIDSGLERRVMIDDDGVQSLELNHISRADCMQRAGRCGRTHDGYYTLTRYISSEMRKKKRSDDTLGVFRFVGLDEQYHKVSKQGRLDYPIPEILRTNADKSTLAMAAAGLDIKHIELYHPISDKVLKRSANLLRVLGAFDANNVVTQRGRRMNQFPVRPSFARMLTYAEEQGFSQEAKSYTAAMVAAMETGGLPNYTFGAGKEWRTIAPDRSSDYLSQLQMYLSIQDNYNMGIVAGMDLNPRNVLDARKNHEKLLRRMNVPIRSLPVEIDQNTREQLSDAVVSGLVDFVYRQNGGEYRRTSEALGRSVTQRVLSDRSLVRGSALYVVGTPYKIPSVGTRQEKHILQDVHVTSAMQLGRMAAELCVWEDEATVWRDGKPKVKQRLAFRQTVPIDQWREIDAEWTPELRDMILRESRNRPGSALKELNDTKRQLERLWHRDTSVPRITQDEIDSILRKLATRTVLSPGQLDDKLRRHMLSNEMGMNNYIDETTVEAIMDRSPDSFEWKGINLQISYKSGAPYLKHASKARVIELLELGNTLKLKDGRKVMITIGRKTQTLWQFSQDKKNGKL
ncbi:MAG: ATP-dependent helicase HrpA [Patescibacteria group bacterium]|jgi:HrpA-like RNA helicase|nr:ATP-dependent helicase HrpA [Patescibacteria group bacterium]